VAALKRAVGKVCPVELASAREDLLQVKHVFRSDELIEPDGAGRYLGPLTRTPRMVRIGPSLSNLLENHISESR